MMDGVFECSSRFCCFVVLVLQCPFVHSRWPMARHGSVLICVVAFVFPSPLCIVFLCGVLYAMCSCVDQWLATAAPRVPMSVVFLCLRFVICSLSVFVLWPRKQRSPNLQALGASSLARRAGTGL